MKSQADKLLEEMGELGLDLPLPFKSEDVVRAFEKKLDQYDLDNVRVSGVQIDLEGDIIVGFEDTEGDELELLFQYDEDEKEITATVLEDEDLDGTEDGEVLMVDLTPMNPALVEVDVLGVRYVNLTDLSWMNKSVMVSLLQAGEVGVDDEVEPAQKKQDAYGNRMGDDLGKLESLAEEFKLMGSAGSLETLAKAIKDRFGYEVSFKEDGKNQWSIHASKGQVDGMRIKKKAGRYRLEIEMDESLDERTAYVVRAGKKIRLPVVRRRRKKRLSAKQKAGIRKSVMKRKAKKSQIQRKRKRSLALRSRTGLKKAKSGERKRFKVQGT